uniref:Uncharacterized protein n=1 Tax=Triticum urartu TaxID=4572 RepID=A0A8R7TJN6_TRIUA
MSKVSSPGGDALTLGTKRPPGAPGLGRGREFLILIAGALAVFVILYGLGCF